MKRHHLPPYHWSIIWKQSMQLWLPFISPLASCRFEIGHTATGSQSDMLTSKVSFASLFWHFQSSSWTTSEKLLGCQSNSIWLQSSEFFFFFNCWKKCSPERGYHPLPLLAPARPTLIFILSRRNLPLLSSRVSFLIPFFSFRSPYTLQRVSVLEWNYIIVPPLMDNIKKYIYLFIYFGILCLSCSMWDF